MRAGRESEDEDAGARIAERRYGTAPVFPIGPLAATNRGNIRAMLAQARAQAALDNAGVQLIQAGRGKKHAPIVGDGREWVRGQARNRLTARAGQTEAKQRHLRQPAGAFRRRIRNLAA